MLHNGQWPNLWSLKTELNFQSVVAQISHLDDKAKTLNCAFIFLQFATREHFFVER